MTNSLQHQGWIPRKSLRAAGAAIALAVTVMLTGVTTQPAQAQTYTVLYSFIGDPDGAYPYGGLVQDATGDLYGTTYGGGSYDWGTVFNVSNTDKETILYRFGSDPNGANPSAGLVRDVAGNLYGTTVGGGSSNLGTVFEVSKSGKGTVLYSFAGGKRDGCHPYGGLLRDKVGNLYGTTSRCGASGDGTVFMLSTTGTETVLHSFAGGSSDGAHPGYTSLLMDTEGNLYGLTSEGGASGKGVVYELSSSGTLTLLYSFAGGTRDGCNPDGKPAMDGQGNLYGTTTKCGSSNEGIVWEVSNTGTETVLHNFTGGPSDGAFPDAGVIMDSSGNLYGDTEEGGASGFGTVYELTSTGTLTLLHNFAGSDGEFPIGGLIKDAEGNLYGTTSEGGSSGGLGTVWKLTP